MIILTLRKSIQYFQEKAIINKRENTNSAYKLLIYNNNLVDEYVTNYEEDIKGKPLESLLFAELAILNKPSVYKNCNRIINSKYTNNDAFFKMLIKNKADKELNRIVEAEIERITKNLDYVEQVMRKYEIPVKRYKEILNEQENRSVANRQKILEEVAIRTNQINAEEGLNIKPHVNTYRNPEITAEALLRQSRMTAEYDEKKAINEKYINEGKSQIFTKKKWIWTGRGRTTRHASNNMQTVDIDEPFIVLNDKTLDVDVMMYPSDPAGGFSNAWICYCECEYF